MIESKLISKLLVADLRSELIKRNLTSEGKKSELVERLQNYVQKYETNNEPITFNNFNVNFLIYIKFKGSIKT